MAVSGSLSTTKYDGRYYTLSWTAEQSTATNQSTIKWTLKAVGGVSSWYRERTLKVVIDGATVYSKTAEVERYAGNITSGTKVLTHNSEGAKSFTIKVEAAVYVSDINCTGSKSFTLDNIPKKATITSAPNFNDEANPKITYENLAGSGVTSLQAGIFSADSVAYAAYRDIPKTGSSYTFNLTEAERNKLRAATPNSNTLPVRFYIRTVIGGVTYTHYVTKTLTIVNAAPVLAPVAYDVDAKTLALTGDSAKAIKYYSDIYAKSGAIFSKYATAKSYKLICGGTTGTVASGTFLNVTSGTVDFSVTDSRGNTATGRLSLPLINYIKLSCSLSVAAPTAAGDMQFTVKGNYFNGSFGAVNNVLTLYYRIKANDEAYSDWVTISHTLSGNSYTATVNLTGLNYLNAYTVEVKAVDKLATVTPAAKTVKSTPIFDWGANDFNFNVPVILSNHKPLQGKATDGSNKNLIYLTSGDSVQVGGGAYPPDNIYISTKDNAGTVAINGRQYGTNKILWSGSYYMSAGQTAKLSEGISKQPNGIVLVFSRYNTATSEALDQQFSYHFVPKIMLEFVGDGGSVFPLRASNETYAASKYLYFDDDITIRGHDNNKSTGTGSNGVTFNNAAFVLRFVIGV